MESKLLQKREGLRKLIKNVNVDIEAEFRTLVAGFVDEKFIGKMRWETSYSKKSVVLYSYLPIKIHREIKELFDAYELRNISFKFKEFNVDLLCYDEVRIKLLFPIEKFYSLVKKYNMSVDTDLYEIIKGNIKNEKSEIKTHKSLLRDYEEILKKFT